MKTKRMPLNIKLLDPGPKTFAGLLPVTDLMIYDPQTGDFSDRGLYSNIIFGKQGDKRRSNVPGFIDLKTSIIQPHYLKELLSTKSLYKDIIYGTGYAVWDDKVKDFFRSDMMEGETGMAFFTKHFNDIVFVEGPSKKRSLRIDFLYKYRPVALTSKVIVFPAGLRDIQIDDTGRPVEDDINGLYRKLIAAANTINPRIAGDEDFILDAPRASLTKNFEKIYDYFFNVFEGKKGLGKGKFASRGVIGGTMNVISSMPYGNVDLGSERQTDVMTTHYGVFQFMKMTEELTIYQMKNGWFEPFFDSIMDEVVLTKPDDLTSVRVSLGNKTKDKWGTYEGQLELINGYKEGVNRNKPIMVDGYYLSLIYSDEKSFKFLHSMADVPDGIDKSKIRPLTWADFFYVHAAPNMEKARSFATRYPVIGLGSNVASKIYLKTTSKAFVKYQLNDDWQPSKEFKYLEYPDVENDLDHFSTMAVHSATLPAYDGDFD